MSPHLKGAGSVHHSCGLLQHSAPQEPSLVHPARAVVASGDDYNSGEVPTTHHAEVSQPPTPDELTSVMRKRFIPPRMVAGVRKIAPRRFSVKR